VPATWGKTLTDLSGVAKRALKALTVYLTSDNQTEAAPDGTVAALRAIVEEWLGSSEEPDSLYQRYRREPDNEDVQSAVQGRLIEEMLDDPKLAQRLEAALNRIETAPSSTATTTQDSTFISTVTGKIRGSTNITNQGSGSIDASTTKNRKMRLSFPIAGVAALLLVGGGSAATYTIENGNSDAGEYVYFATPDDQPGGSSYVLMTWNTDNNTHVDGSFAIYGFNASGPPTPSTMRDSTGTDLNPIPLTGYQHGNLLDTTMTVHSPGAGTAETRKDEFAIDGDTLRKGERVFFHKAASRTEAIQAMIDYHRNHPNVNGI
jgi:hypothetical protein